MYLLNWLIYFDFFRLYQLHCLFIIFLLYVFTCELNHSAYWSHTLKELGKWNCFLICAVQTTTSLFFQVWLNQLHYLMMGVWIKMIIIELFISHMLSRWNTYWWVFLLVTEVLEVLLFSIIHNLRLTISLKCLFLFKGLFENLIKFSVFRVMIEFHNNESILGSQQIFSLKCRRLVYHCVPVIHTLQCEFLCNKMLFLYLHIDLYSCETKRTVENFQYFCPDIIFVHRLGGLSQVLHRSAA